MGLIDGLHNVPERFKRCCSSLAPPPTNNNNNIGIAFTIGIDFYKINKRAASEDKRIVLILNI